MTIQQMRIYISQHPKYANSESWRTKCMTMPDRTVVAIYNKFKNINYNDVKREMEFDKALSLVGFNKKEEQYHQVDMFEYLAEKENLLCTQ